MREKDKLRKRKWRKTKMQQRRQPARKRRPGRSDLTPAAQSCLTGSKELPKNGSRDMSGGDGGGEVPHPRPTKRPCPLNPEVDVAMAYLEEARVRTARWL